MVVMNWQLKFQAVIAAPVAGLQAAAHSPHGGLHAGPGGQG